jgi:hypothetical protein
MPDQILQVHPEGQEKATVQGLNEEKAPVREILKLLGVVG